jgi:hypothetical protein
MPGCRRQWTDAAIVIDHAYPQEGRRSWNLSKRRLALHQRTLPVLLAPAEYLVRVHIITPSHNRYRRTRHKCFFHDPALLGDRPPLESLYNLRHILISTSHKLKVCPQCQLWTLYTSRLT